MPEVQMLVHISGTRPDGSPWPPRGYILDLDDWEAEHLINGDMAREAPPVPPDEIPPGEIPPGEVPPGEVQPVDPGEPDAPTQTLAAEGVAPKPVQPKADWVAWAVANGMTEEEASAMTKQDLMEQFGSRA